MAEQTRLIAVGDPVPDVKVWVPGDEGMEAHQTSDLFAGKHVACFFVPGAFTPTCNNQLPGFVKAADDFRAAGVDEILCVSVNDAFVMQAWGKAMNADGKVTMVGDGNGDFTRSIGASFDGSGFGLSTRAIRLSMLVRDGVVEHFHVEENPGALEVSDAMTLLADL
ncbi:peroxiredoxin [Kiloniella sp. b19]|uniref:peroxiredoxin n=1 Tax=Kiloniella sp. GXU_MW_B19 TaxID=3141326 RepID=UPI0031E2B4BE